MAPLTTPHALRQLRPHLRDRLLAAPDLAGLPVLLDDLPAGAPAPLLEDALREHGVCISIPPLLSLSLPAPLKTPHLFGVEAELTIHLRTAPATRARLAAPAQPAPVEDLVEALLRAGAGATPSPGSVHGLFQPAAEAAQLLIEDAGCITYAVRFTARLTLSSAPTTAPLPNP